MSDVTLRVSADERTFLGTVVETFFGQNEDTLDVAFPGSDAPPLEVGAETKFTVSSESLAGDLDLAGVVRDVRREAAELRLLLACPVEAEGEPSHDDRRGAMRVKPEVGAVVASISVWDGAWTREPLINDLSATGLSFLLPAGHEELEVGTLLAIGLFADSEGALDLAARVRYRRRVGPFDLYGAEFDAEATEDLSHKQLQIHFVVERRRELLARRQA